MSRRYPLEPFLDATGWTMEQVRDVAPCNGEEYRRRRSEGVTEAIADRLAVAAGLHPEQVWGEGFGLPVCAAPDCDETFIPADARQRYCSHRCVQRLSARRRRASRPRGATSDYDRNYYQQYRAGILRQRQRDYWADPGKYRARKRAERQAKKKITADSNNGQQQTPIDRALHTVPAPQEADCGPDQAQTPHGTVEHMTIEEDAA